MHPQELNVQQGLPIAVPVQPTGDARVEAALERVQELDQVTTLLTYLRLLRH